MLTDGYYIDDEKDNETSEEKKSKEDFMSLTELVDQMTGTGYYDIYTDTYEKLKFKIKTVCFYVKFMFLKFQKSIIELFKYVLIYSK